MKIKTDYVPDDCDFLTAGKEYKVKKRRAGPRTLIYDDHGRLIMVNMRENDERGIRKWQIVEEKPFDISDYKFSNLVDGLHVETIKEVEAKEFLSIFTWNGCCNIQTPLNKADAIAIAKALGVTGGDLWKPFKKTS